MHICANIVSMYHGLLANTQSTRKVPWSVHVFTSRLGKLLGAGFPREHPTIRAAVCRLEGHSNMDPKFQPDLAVNYGDLAFGIGELWN